MSAPMIADRTQRWNRLLKTIGGVSACAKALKTSVANVYRWSTGRMMPRPTFALRIRKLAEKVGVPSPVKDPS